MSEPSAAPADKQPAEHDNWKTPFFTIWTGQAFSLLGSRLVQFALVWWLTKETESATVLATASLVAMLPQVVAGPFIGALVDRWNRRRVMMVADSLIALATLGLALLFLLDVAQVWHIYIILLLRSLGGAFHWPAMQASTSLMVPKEQLSRVAGMNQTLRGAVDIVGPPLGALLLELLPMQGVLAVDVVTAMIAVTSLFFVDIPQPVRKVDPAATAQKPSLWSDFREGLRYVAGWPGLMAIMVMAALINFLFTPAGTLTPLLVKEHFDGGAFHLGWIEAAWGVGFLLGGLTLSIWGGFKRGIFTSMTGMMGMGVGAVILGLAPAGLFALAVGGMFLMGIMNPITNGPLFAVMQKSVAPEMQGRVFTLLTSVAMVMSPLSLAVAGPVADTIGIQSWYILAGVGCIIASVIGMTTPVIVNLEENNRANGSATAPAKREGEDALEPPVMAAGASLEG